MSNNSITNKRAESQVQERALHIAAVIMHRADLCKEESPSFCKKTYVPREADCARCIEKWLLAKAREEMRG